MKANRAIRSYSICAAVLAALAMLPSFALAQEQGAGDLAKQSQNPVADLISLPFQNNTFFGFGPDDDVANVLNIQPVIPVNLGPINLINRTIVPLIYLPDVTAGLAELPEGVSGGSTFGLGDINYTGFLSPVGSGPITWGGRVPFVARPNAFAGGAPFLFEGPISRTVEDAALALTAVAGYDPRDPHSLDEQVDFTAATRRSIRGWKIAYSPNLDVFPMDRRVTDVVGVAIRVFEEAGAHVEEIKVGIERPQKELSDLWCRLIMPLNVQTFDIIKRAGLDLLKDHRDDFPPEYLRWLDVGYRMSALDFFKDQEIRSEIYDAIQGVLNRYDLLITPTLACLPVANADDNNTMGPTAINGEEVDPLIGWCLTYFINFSGHPAASIPAGLSADNLPVGMQIIGRRYADADVLAASAVFERLRPWHDTYRICAQRAI